MEYSLAFVHVFDLVLLIALVHYYRKLGYGFLKFGALSILALLPVQLLDHAKIVSFSPFFEVALIGLASLVYSALLLACVSDIVRKGYPSRYLVATGLMFAGTLIYAALQINTLWLARIIVCSPAMVLAALSVFMLLHRQGQHRDSIGSLWFASLIVLEICVGIVKPFYTDGSAIGHYGLLEDLVHLLIGVSLIMITSEKVIRDLFSKDQRIEEYVEERKRLELQFSHGQKLESLGLLAGGMAHDFNNMLTSILGYAGLAMKKLPADSEIRKDLYMVMSGARQAVDLTSQMLIYAGKGASVFEAVDISRAVDDMSSLLDSIVPGKIQLVQRLSRDLPLLRGDKVQLGQAVLNLVANAVDAIEDTGVIEVSTGITEVDDALLKASFFAEERDPGAYLFLRVKDTGIGMNEEQVVRIFDPFYSEKQTNKGLGLSSLSGVVRQHKGFISVYSRPEEGSEFGVYFPVVAYQEASDSNRLATRPKDQTRGRVLIADDDPRIRSLMGSILEADHLILTSAGDGKEALRIFEREAGQFDLLLLDCTMPKMSGAEVYHKVRAASSQVPVILVSGYHQEQVARSIDSDPNAYFIKKPFNVDTLLAEVRNALGSTQVA